MTNSMEPKKEALTPEMLSAGTKQLLNESQQEKESYTTTVLGHEFVVLPNVFSPKYFNDSEIFARELPIHRGETLFEAGPGTGVISINAIFRGAQSATAVDINPDAVKNTQINIDRFALKNIRVLRGDVYSPLSPDEKFDVICWNVPFELTRDENISDLERSVLDPGYKAITRFINGAQNHLNEKGRLYIGFSSTLGDYGLLKRIASDAGYDLLTVYSEKSTEVHPVKFEIIQAIPRP